MLTLFVLEGFWLWGAIIACALILGVYVYHDSYRGASLDVVALIALLCVTGNMDLADAWHFAAHNPFHVVVGVGAYLLLGVLWARLKWSVMLSKLKEQIDIWRSSVAKANAIRLKEYEDRVIKAKIADKFSPYPTAPEKPVANKLDLNTMPYDLREQINVNEDERIRINVGYFKGHIMGWIAYWPVSAAAWLIGDFVHDLLEQLYRLVKDYFQELADSKLNS